MRCIRQVGALVLATCLSGPAFAHPETDVQIALLTAEIAETSGSADLFTRRGELYLEHDNTTQALSDFARAISMEAGYLRARTGEVVAHLKSGNVGRAEELATSMTETHPSNQLSWLTRAAVMEKTQQHQRAAEDLAEAIRLSPQPDPDLYVRQSTALLVTDPGNVDEAIAVLEQGMKRLGNLITLNERALDLEQKYARYEAALARLNGILAAAPRKEKWLLRRGQILEAAERNREAKQAYKQVVDEIAGLSAGRRETSSTMELLLKAEAGVARIQD